MEAITITISYSAVIILSIAFVLSPAFLLAGLIFTFKRVKQESISSPFDAMFNRLFKQLNENTQKNDDTSAPLHRRYPFSFPDPSDFREPRKTNGELDTIRTALAELRNVHNTDKIIKTLPDNSEDEDNIEYDNS